MAYQTGVASTMSDIVSAIQSFAIANCGFSAGTTWGYTSGAYTYSNSTIVKNGVTYGFTVPAITNPDSGVLYLNTFVGSPVTTNNANATIQPNACPKTLAIQNLQGPFVGYHMFTDGNFVNVAVEIVAGVFAHLNFGEMTKVGAWTGGGQVLTGGPWIYNLTYAGNLFAGYAQWPFRSNGYSNDSLSSSQSFGHVRVPTLGPTSIIGYSSAGTSSMVANSATCRHDILLDFGANASNGRAPLVPINLHQSNGGTASPWMHLGYISNARFINIENLNPKDVVNTNWMVFPISQKNGPASAYLNSQNYGIAYQQ